MAFGIPTIGLGGVLDFNARPATQGLKTVTSAFTRFKNVGARVSGGLQRLSGGFAQLQTLAMGLGAVGIGSLIFQTKSLLSQMVDLENIQTSVASNMMIIRDISMDQALVQAADAMNDLRILAVQTPGEVQDVANMWNLVLEPMTRAGQEQEQINKLTKNAIIAAGALNIPFRDMAESSLKMMNGQLDMGSQTVIKLKGAAEKLGIEWNTQAFTALTMEERIEKLHQVFGLYEASADAVGSTWSAMFSTIRSLVLFLFNALAAPALEVFRKNLIDTLGGVNTMYETIEERAKVFGEKLMPFFIGLIDGFKTFVGWIRAAIVAMSPIFEKVQSFMSDIGIDLESIGKLTGIVTAVGMVLLSFAAFIAPLVLAIGAVVTAATTIGGAVAEMWPVFVAVLVIIQAMAVSLGGMFVAAKSQGMSFGELLSAIWTKLKGLGQSFMANVQLISSVIMPRIKASWDLLKPAIMGVMTAVGSIIGGIWKAISPLFMAVMGFAKSLWLAIGKLIQPIATFASTIFTIIGEALTFLSPVISAILAVAVTFYSVWLKVYGFLVENVLPIFGVILVFMGDWLKFLWGIAMAAVEGWKIIWTWVKPLFDWISKKLTPAFEFFGKLIKTVAGWIYTALGTALKFIAFTIASILEGISSGMEALGLEPQFTGTITALKDLSAAKTGLATPAGAPAAETEIAKSVTKADTKGPAGLAGAFECPDINLNQKTSMNVDGKEVATASANYKTEVGERSGYSITPWQQRKVLLKAESTP